MFLHTAYYRSKQRIARDMFVFCKYKTSIFPAFPMFCVTVVSAHSLWQKKPFSKRIRNRPDFRHSLLSEILSIQAILCSLAATGCCRDLLFRAVVILDCCRSYYLPPFPVLAYRCSRSWGIRAVLLILRDFFAGL